MNKLRLYILAVSILLVFSMNSWSSPMTSCKEMEGTWVGEIYNTMTGTRVAKITATISNIVQSDKSSYSYSETGFIKDPNVSSCEQDSQYVNISIAFVINNKKYFMYSDEPAPRYISLRSAQNYGGYLKKQ